jgi:hypothetical protein
MKHVHRALTGALVALMLTAGVAFQAFAGGSSGGGGDHGNKYGNVNKNDTQTCRDGYELAYVGLGNPYDLNDNGFVCWKAVDSDIFYVDDISHTTE